VAFIDFELPMDEGWVRYNWCIETDGWKAFSGLARVSDGYIKQEIARILAQGKASNNAR
jgi:hypothetical protein